MYIAYKFRMYPADEQKIIINKNFGCSRFVYNYYLHKITKEITDNSDIIVIEKLQTKNMLQNRSLSKSIIDASFHEIIRQLQYKSKNKGKYFYQIDTFYPSSQTCSVCGSIDSKYKDLKKREY